MPRTLLAHIALTLVIPCRILKFSCSAPATRLCVVTPQGPAAMMPQCEAVKCPGAIMPIPKTEKIWHNGKLINWDDATLHVLSHVVSYGSAVFEGIRCYDTKQGPAIFRLREHMQRLVNSAKIYRMELPFNVDELSAVATELVAVNKIRSCYVKPIVLRGYGDAGVTPLNNPVEIYMA